MKTLYSLILLLSVSTSHARLGETEAQCLQRYGPSKTDAPTRSLMRSFPLLPGAPERSWDYQGWGIHAAFDATGQVIRIRYQKRPKTGANQFIEDFEFKAILEANGGASNWAPHSQPTGLSPTRILTERINKIGLGETFRRKPDGATVRYKKPMTNVVLELPSVADFERQRKATQEAEARATVPKF
jgi:hypothetical protein